MFYKLTRGSVQSDEEKKQPMHIRYGFGLLEVGGVLVADCKPEGIERIALQRAVHTYAQAAGRQFQTYKTHGEVLCVTIKRLK